MATTKSVTRRGQTPGPTHKGPPKVDRTPLPDTGAWVERVFYSGSGEVAPTGVALLRANPLSSGLDRMVDSAVQMQAETARFCAQRVHRALEAQARLVACRTAEDVRTARQAYLHDLAEDYAHEWNRFFANGMRLAMGQPVAPPREPEDERHATPV